MREHSWSYQQPFQRHNQLKSCSHICSDGAAAIMGKVHVLLEREKRGNTDIT